MLNGSFSTFTFGPFRLLAAERRLEKGGKPVRLVTAAATRDQSKSLSQPGI